MRTPASRVCRTLAALCLGGFLSVSQTLARQVSFEFDVMTSVTPPDPHIAVGGSVMLVVTNEKLSMFNTSDGSERTGDSWPKDTSGGSGFWSSCSVTSGAFDTLVHWDNDAQRFWITAFKQDAAVDAPRLLIAVSTDSVPSATEWKRYVLNPQDVPNIENGDHLGRIDRPNSSVHPDHLWISFWGNWCNNALCNDEAVVKTAVVVYDKAELMAGDNCDTSVTNSQGLILPLGRKIAPVHARKMDTSDEAPLYLIEVDDEHPSLDPLSGTWPHGPDPTYPGANTVYEDVVLHAVEFTAWNTIPDLTTDDDVEVATHRAPLDTAGGSAYDPSVQQAASVQTERFQINDCRFLDAVYQSDSVWAVHHVRPGSEGTVVPVTRLYQFDMNGFPSGTPVEAQTFTLDPGDSKSTFYPAVTVRQDGHAMAVFNQSSENDSVSIRVWDTESTSFSTVTTSQPYNGNGNGGVQRWGDYAGIAMDGCNYAWVHHVITDDVDVDLWRTWVQRVTFTCSSFGGGPDNNPPGPDLTGDGTLDLSDLLEFRSRMENKDARADLDQDGQIHAFDFLEYMNLWNSGR